MSEPLSDKARERLLGNPPIGHLRQAEDLLDAEFDCPACPFPDDRPTCCHDGDLS